MTITEYCDRVDILKNTPFRITPDGKGHFIYEGREYTREQFGRMFPTPISFVSHNGKGIDGRSNFLSM